MILVDTSVWVDHLFTQDAVLQNLLLQEKVLTHPFVVGEVSLGNMKYRTRVMQNFFNLPSAVIANHEEVLSLIEGKSLFGTGIGYVDTHLLASTRLTENTLLWTRDKRLHAQAERLGLAWSGVRLQ